MRHHGPSGTTSMLGCHGSTIIEMLVAMMLSGVVLAIVARDFGHNVHAKREMDLFAETQQAASSTVTFISQELRQTGACLPQLGAFISLDGQDDGTTDSLTLRIGKAQTSTLQCVRTVLRKRAKKNQSVMKVDVPAGFEAGQRIYVIKGTGHSNVFRIASISGKFITIEGTFDVNYGRGSGVYAFEERHYEIQDSDGTPTLMMGIDGDDPIVMVRGVEKMNFQYLLEPCPPCDVVDEPVDDVEWRRVRKVRLDLTTRSSTVGRDGEYIRIDATSTIKPRNFL